MLGRKLRALVSGNKESDLRLMQLNLERQGYIVEIARDGLECLEKVWNSNPDFLIMDVQMPVIDGYEVLEVIRKDARTKKLPILVLSSTTEDKDIQEAYRRGADMFLPKPFDPRDFRDWSTDG